MRIIWWNIFYSAFSSCDTYVGSDRKYAERKECKRNSGVRNISFETKRVESRKIGKMRVKKGPHTLAVFIKTCLGVLLATCLMHLREQRRLFFCKVSTDHLEPPLWVIAWLPLQRVSHKITNLTRMSFKTEF